MSIWPDFFHFIQTFLFDKLYLHSLFCYTETLKGQYCTDLKYICILGLRQNLSLRPRLGLGVNSSNTPRSRWKTDGAMVKVEQASHTHYADSGQYLTVPVELLFVSVAIIHSN